MRRIEQHIVTAWANRLAAELVRSVICELETMEAMLSGDSGLANVWEELCAQVQGEESHEWAAYVNVVDDLLHAYIGGLDRDAQLALWAITAEGWDYIYDHHADQDGVERVPLNAGDIVTSLAGVVMSKAADYESSNLYRYIWGEDDPEYDEDEGRDEDEAPEDSVILGIHREQIEVFDLESSLSFLRTLVPSSDPQFALSYKGGVSLVIGGYDDDPREIFEIPEVCRYLHEIDREWPFWFFFLNPSDGSLKLAGMCLASAVSVSPGKAYILPDNLYRFMERGFGAVNFLFDHYGFPESDNEALSEVVSQIFAT